MLADTQQTIADIEDDIRALKEDLIRERADFRNKKKHLRKEIVMLYTLIVIIHSENNFPTEV